ncbi:hypothetical protein GN958_ATG19532 [Phytophthora infestans]|uniref:Uncharacterized protein n=1 Tax=Phytophthora infestans TaxID=4787 RepID=A0A8S9TW98_PHYIN|nr:hypothetical protein GN958_ATG19532 [Phytophthora infestans]
MLRRSDIASLGKRFAWFTLRAEDVFLVDCHDTATSRVRKFMTVHIRLGGSKINQQVEPTLRMMNLLGHDFRALCLFEARHSLQTDIPIAVFSQ